MFGLFVLTFASAGLQNTLFTIPSFFSWVFAALTQSAACTFFAYFGSLGPSEQGGRCSSAQHNFLSILQSSPASFQYSAQGRQYPVLW
jgi:magnesium-transporting ATPase (P-type)